MIEAGSNIQAIGTTGYVLAELVDLDDEPAYERIEAVLRRFSDRDKRNGKPLIASTKWGGCLCGLIRSR
jgi:hypothetical protein